MYIEPVALGASDYSWIASTPVVRYTGKTTQPNPFNPSDSSPNPLRDIVSLSSYNITSSEEVEFNPAFIYLYFMYPNDKIRDFAYNVVGARDSDSSDLKMTKIAYWVQKNIQYMTDEENYGVSEFWAPAIYTIVKGAGDCEDGSFLIASLALNSGVPADRIRMYGGYVDAGSGAVSGDHGWVAYRRESDNQWVAVDFSYYPDYHIDSLPPMKEDMKYKDDYFFITSTEITYTSGINRVRDPEGYTNAGQLQYSLLVGQLVNLLW